MRSFLAASVFVMSAAAGWAQTPSPASVGITATAPQKVQVLDSSKTWVTIGTIDPSTHIFTPVGGGGGGGIPEAPLDGQQYGRQLATWTPITGGTPPTGGCNQLNFSVACNSQYLGSALP